MEGTGKTANLKITVWTIKSEKKRKEENRPKKKLPQSQRWTGLYNKRSNICAIWVLEEGEKRLSYWVRHNILISQKSKPRYIIVKLLTTEDNVKGGAVVRLRVASGPVACFCYCSVLLHPQVHRKMKSHFWVSNLSLRGSILKLRAVLSPKSPINLLLYFIGPNLIICHF